MALNARQRAFVEAYCGNAAEAARKAGYSAATADRTGYDLLRNPEIASAIKSRETKRLGGVIATREDRQKFWTDVMNDTGEEISARLKASELLGKSEADFTEKHQHSGGISIGVVDPYAKPEGK